MPVNYPKEHDEVDKILARYPAFHSMNIVERNLIDRLIDRYEGYTTKKPTMRSIRGP